MRTYFKRIDFDGDGAVTRKDFECMGARFVEADKLDAETGKVIQGKLCAVWDDFIGKNVAHGSDGIKETDFITSMEKMVHDPKLKVALAGPLPLFFRAVDANNDGFISEEEYEIFFKIIGLNPGMAKSSFQAIDANNDGLLSSDEFVEAGTSFFLSEQGGCPTKLFWGPLLPVE